MRRKGYFGRRPHLTLLTPAGRLNGLQLHTNVDGHCLNEPRFFPVFEVAAKSGKPILLHPARTASFLDFAAEQKSRYEIWTIFGWPYQTSATMGRLTFSGVVTRLPELKILTHHLGAMIPCFDARIGTGWATLGSRISDEDYSDCPFGPEQGAGYIPAGIACMEVLDIPAAGKDKINCRNAQAAFGLI